MISQSFHFPPYIPALLSDGDDDNDDVDDGYDDGRTI